MSVMTEGLKCSLFGLGLSNTTMKLTRLPMATLGRLKLNSHFPRRADPTGEGGGASPDPSALQYRSFARYSSPVSHPNGLVHPQSVP